MKNLLLCLVILANVANSQVNLTSSLTACYPLNGSGTEPVNGFTGTLSSVTSTVDRFSNANSAYAFSGSTSSYIQLPGNASLKPTNGLSFSAWLKPGTLSSPEYIVFTKNSTSSNFESYALVVASVPSGFKFRVHKGDGFGNTSFVDGTTLISSGTWYHTVFTMDNSSISIYLNGVLEGTVATSYSFNYQSGKDVFLGGTNESIFNGPYLGSMDNVRFYNRVLSAAEISALYSTDPSCIVAPVSSFSVFPSTVCPGKPVVLTDLSTNSPSSWNWQMPGATTPTASVTNPTISFPNPGTYVVSMTSSNSAGASNTSTQSIVVLPLPTVSVLSTPTVCNGDAFLLNASGASSYTWSNNQTGSTQVVYPATNVSYSVIGSGTNGCIGSAAINITVFPAPVLQVSGNSTVCLGSATSLLVNGTAVNYYWNTGVNGNIITVTPQTNTSYTVIGTNAYGCSNVAVQSVYVVPLPVVTAYASNSLVCQGDALILNGSGASTYSWTGGVTNNVPFYPTATNSYTVIGTGINGCKNSASIQIPVSPLPTVTAVSSQQNVCAGISVTLAASGAITYSWSNSAITSTILVAPLQTTNYTVTGTDNVGCKNSFVLVQAIDACTGLKDLNAIKTWKVYPNPASGLIYIEGISAITPHLQLKDALGKELVVKTSAESGRMSVDLSDLPEGFYFLKISTEGQSETIKLLKD